jgi:hypothetical protein
MTELDFEKEMTEAEVAAAREAGELAARRQRGGSLLDDLKIGDMLLFGRNFILNKYHLTAPRGQPYGAYFAAWKRQMNFPAYNDPVAAKAANALYDEAIFCASHRELANEIIASESVKWRANSGVSGLAKRIRTRLRADAEQRASTTKTKPTSLKGENARLKAQNATLKDQVERVLESGGSLFDLKKTPHQIKARIVFETLLLAETRKFRDALSQAISDAERRLRNKKAGAG